MVKRYFEGMKQDVQSATRVRLLDEAAALVQTRGYNGFSFYDLAERVGIKTASIHYHFPTKAALGEALAKRYTQEFLALIGDPSGATPEEKLARYAEVFKTALQSGRMCLCGMLGAEISGVPHEVAREAQAFFDANRTWLKTVFSRMDLKAGQAGARADLVLCALEGAMLVARVSKEDASFDRVVETLFQCLRVT